MCFRLFKSPIINTISENYETTWTIHVLRILWHALLHFIHTHGIARVILFRERRSDDPDKRGQSGGAPPL